MPRQYLNLKECYDAALPKIIAGLGSPVGSPPAPDQHPDHHPELPSLPSRFLARPESAALIVEALTGTAKVIPVTAVTGMGGIGKSVMANAVCRDGAIQHAFPRGVVWTEIGYQPTEGLLVEKIQSVAEALGVDAAGNLNQCLAALRKALAEGSALVVLDDVWDYRDLAPFVGNCGRSRLLVTTRKQEVVTQSGAKEVALERLNISQARSLFAACAGARPCEFPPESVAIIEECGGLPQALAMLGAAVAGDDPQMWRDVRNALAARDFTGVGLDAIIDVSLERLTPDLRQAYLDLGVFRSGTAIPRAVLEVLWDLPQYETGLRMRVLVEAFLATQDERGALRLHDLQAEYLQRNADDVKKLHERMVQGYRRRRPEDEYFWKELPRHLLGAGRTRELRELLLDPEWMRAKLRRFHPLWLLDDYNLAPEDADVQLVRRALELAGHKLAGHPEWLTGQLVGRLTPVAARAGIARLLEDCRATETGAWIEPYRPGLDDVESPLLRTLEGPDAHWVYAVAVTADGRLAVSGSSDATLRVWDMERGTQLRSLEGHQGGIEAAAVTADGRHAVSGSNDGIVKVWDLDRGKLVLTLEGHTDKINAVAVTANGRHVVSGSHDKTVKVWDLERGTLLCTLKGHTGRVRALAITADGRVISGSEDGSLKVWNLACGTLIHTLESRSGIRAVAVTTDGHRVISGSYDKTLKIWDLDHGTLLRTLEGHTDFVLAVAVTADGSQAVSASSDTTLKVWDLEYGTLLRTLEGHVGSVHAVCVSGEGQAVSGSSDGTLKVWDLARRASEGKTLGVNAVAVTPDGGRAVLSSCDQRVTVWDLERRTLLRTLEGHKRGVTSVAVTADGRCAVSSSHDKTFKVWDLERGALLYTLEGHAQAVLAVALTPDGGRAVSGWRGALQVWDLNSGTLLRTLEGHLGRVSAAAVAGDCQRAITGSEDKTLKVWDLQRGALLHTLEGHASGVCAVAVTADGSRAVSGSSDNTVKVWNVDRGTLVHTLDGHAGPVRAVALTACGRFAVTGSSDHTVRVWDLSSGGELASFAADAGIRSCCYTSSDGRTALAGDENGCLHFLQLRRNNRNESHQSTRV